MVSSSAWIVCPVLVVVAAMVSTTTSWVSRGRPRQFMVIAENIRCSIVVWGAAITLFGLSSTLWLGLALLALAGAADTVSAVYRTTILQVATPPGMQGRLQGVFIVVVAGGPRLGDLETGAVAAAFSPQVSVVSGGLACLAGIGLLALAAPALLRYDARTAVADPAADDR